MVNRTPLEPAAPADDASRHPTAASDIGDDTTDDRDTEADGGPLAKPLAAGTVVGEYRIERKIGEGGMGTVYGAIHPVIGKKAAVKLLRAELSMNREAVERFLGEARAVNQIGHPNIVDVFSFGALPDGRRYFVMEWLHGESLAARIDREGGLALADALAILDQVVAALAAAHDRGIVHRDLKPDNVFLGEVRGEPPRVKLLDFGIAKLVGAPLGVKRTKTGALMGTPGYIAPEQARGDEVDARADIYALGCMAFEMLTGQLPFVSDSAMVIITKHLTEDPPAPSSIHPEDGLPPEVDGLILSMLAKDRTMRPSLEQVRARMQALARSASTAAASAPRRPRGISRAPTATPASTGVVVAPLPIDPAVTAAPGPSPVVAQPAPPLADDDAPVTVPRSRLPLVLGGAVAVAAAVALVVVATGGKGAARSTPPPPGSAVAAPGEVVAPPPPTPPPPPAVVDPPAVTTGHVRVTITGGKEPTLEVDGAPVAVRGGVAELELVAGAHELVAGGRRVRAERRQVTVTGGQALAIDIPLVAERSGGARPPGTGRGTAGSGSGSAAPPPPDDDALLDPFHKRGSGGPR